MTAETERLRMLEIARCRARAEMNAERANPRGGDPLFVIARDRAPHGTPADWDAIVEANRWVRRRFERLGSLVWKQRDTIHDLHYFLVLATIALPPDPPSIPTVSRIGRAAASAEILESGPARHSSHLDRLPGRRSTAPQAASRENRKPPRIPRLARPDSRAARLQRPGHGPAMHLE